MNEVVREDRVDNLELRGNTAVILCVNSTRDVFELMLGYECRAAEPLNGQLLLNTTKVLVISPRDFVTGQIYPVRYVLVIFSVLLEQWRGDLPVPWLRML